MKRIIITLLILTAAISADTFAQRHKYMERSNKKIEELQKIKLLETLNMDEETALKFFTRRNDHRQRMRELNEQSYDYIEKLEAELKTDSRKEINSLINAYLENEKRIVEERTNFISSVSEILTREQLASLLVFEQRFREEVRNIILRERRKSPK